MSSTNHRELLTRLEAVEDALKLAFDTLRKVRVAVLEADPNHQPILTPIGATNSTVIPANIPGDPAGALLQIHGVAPPPDPEWIPIYHRIQRPYADWPYPCGKPGLYLTEYPTQHTPARFSVMRIRVHTEREWRIPTTADEPRCSSCFALIDPFSNKDLDYLSVMQPSTPPTTGSEPIPAPRSYPLHTSEATQKDIDALRELAGGLGLDTPY